MPGKSYFLYTFGCQMNEYDSEVISGLLEGLGLIPAAQSDQADMVVVNTCCVRTSAEQKIYSLLGRLIKAAQGKKQLIAVGGCMTQQKGMAAHLRQRFPAVRLIFGTCALPRLPELVQRALQGEMVVDVEENSGIIEGLPGKRKNGIKAWVPIMYGCNNFCTYCIVPYVRGRERSRLPAGIENEVLRLGGEGYREVTLLGQNVNSYGRDLPEGVDFAGLLQRLDLLGAVSRLRYMTSHPRDFTDRIIATIAGSKAVCEHFHLPVQSGSDRILRIMGRGYTRADYLDLVRRIRRSIPRATITTDLIVGFPGEMDSDFLDTLRLIEEVRFDAAFTFIYNTRPGTPAASMPEQIPQEVKKERIALLIKRQNAISLELNRSMVGQVEEVLVEGTLSRSALLAGRTRGNKLVTFPGDPALTGHICRVRINRAGIADLAGDLLQDE